VETLFFSRPLSFRRLLSVDFPNCNGYVPSVIGFSKLVSHLVCFQFKPHDSWVEEVGCTYRCEMVPLTPTRSTGVAGGNGEPTGLACSQFMA
jgi:hypothetical protein